MRSTIGLLVCLIAVAPSAWSQASERFLLRDDFRTGRDLHHVIETSAALPQYKRFFELSLSQKAVTRTWYVGLLETDDPPFPESGVGWYVQGLQTLSQDLHVQGELAVEITVAADGKPSAVRLIRAPTKEVGRMALFIARRMKFSPALCDSLPCSMSYPLAVRLLGP